MMHCKPGVLLSVLLLLWIDTGGAAQVQEIKVAVISAPDSKLPGALHELLEIQLGHLPGVVLLDRTHVEPILREHRLQMAFHTGTLGQRRELGKLLRANLLIILSDQRGEEVQMAVATVIDVSTGLRLQRSNVNIGDPVDASVRVFIDGYTRASQKLGEERIQVVAVSPVLSQDLGHRYDHSRYAYQALLEQYVGETPGRYLVEIDEARAFMQESRLSQDVQGIFDHEVPLFIEVSSRNDGAGVNRRVTLNVVVREGLEIVAEEASAMAPDDVAEYLRQIVRRYVENTRIEPPVKKSGRMEEATVLWRRAHEFMHLGQYREALGLLEAALLVVPDDETCDLNGWGKVIDARMKNVTVPYRGIVCYELLRVCAHLLEAGKGIIYGDIANQYLEEWIYTDITKHSKSWTCVSALNTALYPTKHIPPLAKDNSNQDEIERVTALLTKIYQDRSAMALGFLEWMAVDPSRRDYEPKGFRDRAHEFVLNENYNHDFFRMLTLLEHHPGGTKKRADYALQLARDDRISEEARAEAWRQFELILGEAMVTVLECYGRLARASYNKPHLMTDAPDRWQAFIEEIAPVVEELRAALKRGYGENIMDRLVDWNQDLSGDPILLSCRDIWMRLELPEVVAFRKNKMAADAEKAGVPLRSDQEIRESVRERSFQRQIYSKEMVPVPQGHEVIQLQPMMNSRVPIPDEKPLKVSLSRVDLGLKKILSGSGKPSPITSWTSTSCGDDVIVQGGSRVYRMSEKGNLVMLYEIPAAQRGVEVAYALHDGVHYWLYLKTSEPSETSLMALDRNGKVIGKQSVATGLPPCSLVLGDAIEPGSWFCVGYLSENNVEQAWLAVISLREGNVHTDVFHEARRQADRYGRARHADSPPAEVAFRPDYVKLFKRDGQLLGVTGSRMSCPLVVDIRKQEILKVLSELRGESRCAVDDNAVFCFRRNMELKRVNLDTLSVDGFAKWHSNYNTDVDNQIASSHGMPIYMSSQQGLNIYVPDTERLYSYTLPRMFADGFRKFEFFRSSYYGPLLYEEWEDKLFEVLIE